MPKFDGEMNYHELRNGVFQPGRAEIAHEMKSRLMLDSEEPPRVEPRPEALSQPVFSG